MALVYEINHTDQYFDSIEDITPIVQFVINLWKKKTKNFVHPEPTNVHNCVHDCTNCKMYKIDFEIYLDSKTLERCNVLVNEFKIAGLNVDRKDWNLVKTVDFLYVCLRSGEYHICGKLCDSMEINGKDHMYVCKFTGYSTGHVETKSMFDFMVEKSSEERRMYKDMNNPTYEKNLNAMNKMFGFGKTKTEVIEDGPAIENLEDAIYRSETLSMNMFDRSDVISKKRKDMNPKERAFINGYAMLNKIFSEERFKIELKESLQKNVEITNEVERYFNKCHQNGATPSILDAWQLMRWKRLEEYSVPHLNLDPKARSDIAFHYARKCMCLYGIIRTRTKLGKTKPGLFPLNDFILGALKIFEDGLRVNVSQDREPITIIEKDTLLGSFPLGNHTSMERKGYRISLKNLEKIRSKESVSENEEDNDWTYKQQIQETEEVPAEVNSCSDSDMDILSQSSEDNIKKKERKKRKKNGTPKKKVGKKGKSSNKMRADIERALSESIVNNEVSPEHLKVDSIEYESIDVDIFYNCHGNIGRKSKKQKK